MAESRYSNLKYFIDDHNQNQFLISTIPSIITTTILSPFTRLKILLQVMPCISILEAEKESKPYRLAKSNQKI
jgi:hypothetical protein